ncbi:hamartin [Centruroides vittatus]|uniref:hamartin n=1 Tax=Centruroides vittatus TaxID=120091 RepID=UPI00350F52F2
MYHRGEKKEQAKSGTHHIEVVELLSLLETNDNHVVEEIKMLIHEQLNNTKEAWLLHGLVDYFLATQSQRCLEIIVGVREPHDKHLFDKLADCLKGNSRYPALTLLGYIVRRHPSWLHKITQHRIMHNLINILKTDTTITNLVSAVLIIVTLLPAIPSLIGSHLQEIFESFSHLASWSTKKPGNIPEIFILHLQVSVYALFHRLYAMYPCNFLAYLRSYYGRRDQNQESFHVFTETIKPMLERVRLHPLLVTASKETELTTTRWKKMEIHDILVECARVSLDLIEGACEEVPQCQLPKPCQIMGGKHGFSASNVHRESTSLPFTPASPTSVVNEALTKCQTKEHGYIWSPSTVCDLDVSSSNKLSPSETSTTSTQPDSGLVALSSATKVGESPPLDVAIEAKPEEASMIDSLEASSRKNQGNVSVNSITGSSEEVDVNIEINSMDNSQSEEQLTPNADSSKSSLPDVSQAEEAREEEIIDEEVSAIVSNSKYQYPSCNDDVGHDTPFFSTTQKLTDEPQTPCELSTLDNTQLSNQSQEEEVETNVKDGVNMQKFVRNANRLRFLSHHGPPPIEIFDEFEFNHQTKKKFLSCPDIRELQQLIRKKENSSKNSSFYNIIQQENIGSQVIDKPYLKKSIDNVTQFIHSKNSVQDTTLFSTADNSYLSKPINDISENITKIEEKNAYSFIPVHNTKSSSQTSCENTTVTISSPPYSHLFPFALEGLRYSQPMYVREYTENIFIQKPKTMMGQVEGRQFYGERPFYTTLSPPEILDRHLQLGNDVYMKELNVPLTSTIGTDWTHFGGQPPADVLRILRGQVLLLHNQLLFERNKREIHAERNRRLLGKAKRAWMLEEQNGAMKDQLQLQERKIQDLENEINKLSNLYLKQQDAKEQKFEELNKRLRELTHNNIALKEINSKIDEQLIQQKQENEVLRCELRKVYSQLAETKLELDSAFRQVNRCQKLEEEAKWLSKQVVLLGEMNQHFRERIESLQPTPVIAAEEAMWKTSALSEISALKQKLEAKTILLEDYQSKNAQLETAIANNTTIMAEQKQLLEMTKSCHQDILNAKDSKIATLQKIWEQQEVYILELQQKLKIAESKASTPTRRERQKVAENIAGHMPVLVPETAADETDCNPFRSEEPASDVPDAAEETSRMGELRNSDTPRINRQRLCENLESCADLPESVEDDPQSQVLSTNGNDYISDSVK